MTSCTLVGWVLRCIECGRVTTITNPERWQHQTLFCSCGAVLNARAT